MFKKWFLFSLFLTPLLAEETTEEVAKVSEAMGHIIGKNLEALGLDFDLDALVKGLLEEAQGKASPLSEEECVQTIALLQEEKILKTGEQELEREDAVSNGDQIDENRFIPTPDSAKYR